MAKLLMAFMVCFVSRAALADYSGNWRGSGRAQTPEWQALCDSMGFQISHENHRFSIVSGRVQCGGNEMNWDPISARIIGKYLYYGIIRVGTYDENGVHIDAVDPRDGIRYIVDVVRNGRHLVYRESRWKRGAQQLVMEGVLGR
ncbi:MAG: hypothetical protein KF865_14580 [Bdellovibrionaceae bacterium]|nr:hypothetical protein [Pseudobdellovibrionaceae bacterium]